MKFQIKDLKKLLYSIQQNNVNEITVNSNTFKLTINKAKISKTLQINNYKQVKNLKSIKKNIALKEDNLYKDKITNDNAENYSTIVSPMVGTFYRSPAPNESAFIELYDVVQKKQTVCIIEAMKLMNEIESEVNGEIVEILVQDGDIIDCGQALMRVKPII
uniref:Biotin carboxyl carrier protein of acetyl-CoA carboxylase n=1 Tax=Leiomenia cribrosa TaxID=217483 RepID=A0A4D6WVI5_9FLOR|nr:acetyl-CoA carboxylase, biotin carboxyl carrier protein [Leiomenia cribrosa]